MSATPEDRTRPKPASTPLTRIGVVAKPDLHRASKVLDELVAWLCARSLTVLVDHETARLTSCRTPEQGVPVEAMIGRVDLIVLLGGDGTLLGTADRLAMAGASIPILGVNFGSLGFLTEITLPELYGALDLAITGAAPIEERLMMKASILSEGVVVEEVHVLNDVVVTRGTLSRMTDLSVFVNDQFVARFKADGLIVATATGSTAYNLSAGGPIVHPGVDALTITPIAPHTLTNRPIVIPASATLKIQPVLSPQSGGSGQQQDVFVTFDGQIGHPLPADRLVQVTRSEHALQLVRPTTRSYFEVLRQKLKWAER